ALKNPILSRIEASLPRGDENPAALTVLKGRDGAEFTYRRGSLTSDWCDSARGCLSFPAPRMPLAQGKASSSSEGAAVLWTSRLSEVFPVLPGRVTRTDS